MTAPPEDGGLIRTTPPDDYRSTLWTGWAESPSGHRESGCVRINSSNGETIEDCPTQIQLRLAPNAVVCGALGCRETEPLLSVTVGAESRVLCPDCATEFVEQEGADG